jgi:hypothetical protein
MSASSINSNIINQDSGPVSPSPAKQKSPTQDPLAQVQTANEIKDLHTRPAANEDVFKINKQDQVSLDWGNRLLKKGSKTMLLGLGVAGITLGVLLHLITIPALAFPFYVLGGIGFMGHLAISDKKDLMPKKNTGTSEFKIDLNSLLGNGLKENSKPWLLLTEHGRFLEALNHTESELIRLEPSLPTNSEKRREIEIQLTHLLGITETLLEKGVATDQATNEPTLDYDTKKGLESILIRTKSLIEDNFPQAETQVQQTYKKRSKG